MISFLSYIVYMFLFCCIFPPSSNSLNHLLCHYILGSCGSGSKDLFSCNNSRCIDKKFTCRDWNACGDNSDCSEDDNVLDEELVMYFVYGIGAVVGISVLYVLYKCAKCTKKCIDKCFDCCTDCIDDCECDCSDVDCSCCRTLVGGVLAGCWRLKSTLTSRFAVNNFFVYCIMTCYFYLKVF